MRKFSVITILLMLAGLTSACSLYQSRGRKELASNAYSYAELAAAIPNYQSCGPVEETLNWQELTETEDVVAFTTDEDSEFSLQIADRTLQRSCLFSFSSQRERDERLKAAIELTLLHFSLGEFAFSHQMPIKYQ